MQYQVTHDNLQACLDSVAKGIGTIWIRTVLRQTYINAKVLKAWSKVPGKPLLYSEGNGFRMREGKGSGYLFPGQLILEVNG